MKNRLIALLIMLAPLGAFAQRNVVFADAGVSLARNSLGGSVTYNYTLARYVAVGAGVQDCDFRATRTTFQYIPAIYGEVRFSMRARKNGQLFSFLDAGVDLYKHKDWYWGENGSVYDVQKDNGLYTALGIGYFRRITGRGWGPYTSLKLLQDFYKADKYDLVTGDHHTATWGGGTMVFSLGFKF